MDRIHQVIAGRELEAIDARRGEGLAQTPLALSRRGREALAEAFVVRVDEDCLAGLGVAERQQPEIRQLGFERIMETDGDDLVALGEERVADGRRMFGIASAGAFFPMVEADALREFA